MVTVSSCGCFYKGSFFVNFYHLSECVVKCLNVQFFLAIFLSNLSLVLVGSFLVYSIITVLFSCCLVDGPNVTLWTASYLWLNVTRGLLADIWMFCSHLAASAVLGISE